MNRLKNVLIILLMFSVSEKCRGQLLYQAPVSTEEERRNIYAMDDWVGYGGMEFVQSMTADDTYIYLATWGSGIWRFNKTLDMWEYPITVGNGLPDNYVNFVYYDEQNNLLFAYTATDSAVYNYGFEIWQSKSEHPFMKFKPLYSDNYNSAELISGRFYGKEYLNKLGLISLTDPEYMLLVGWKIQDREFRQYQITGFIFDEYDHLLLAVENLGIALGSKSSGTVHLVRKGTQAVYLRSFYFTDDAVWMGGKPVVTDLGNIVKWNNDDTYDYFRAKDCNRMYSDNVRFIVGDSAEIYFATDMGILVFDIAKKSWMTVDQTDGLIDDNVNTLMLEDSVVWVGTGEGLSILNRKNKKCKSVWPEMFNNQSINKFYRNGNRFYIASSIGLFSGKIGKLQLVREEILPAFSTNYLTAVAVNDTVMWVAGEYGIGKLDLRKNVWESFSGIHEQIAGKYNDIIFYEDGIFIATNKGLVRYEDYYGKWQIYTEVDGLMSNKVFQLYLDNGVLWMATEAGICRFFWERHIRIN